VTANAANRLIQHYVDNFRRLPWRPTPGAPAADPYRVWLSEVMLQQTTVAAVLPRFERFVARWPTVEALAAAPQEDVLQEWAGLGYYARARNLIACARDIARLGGFPKSAAELRKLPGIGDYTAAAIAAIAFGEAAPAVDTNVERVIARLLALARADRCKIHERLLAMMAGHHPGEVAQALMDLGASICRPKAPNCAACPLRGDCAAYASGTAEAFPAPRERRVRPHRHGIAYWIERDGYVWLVRRPAMGLLGGMAALPGGEWTDKQGNSSAALGTVRHVFTHFSLNLQIVRGVKPVGEGWWQPVDRLADAGLPTLYRRAAEVVLAAAETARAAA
jgi:A/G-specific adenine glycosylase